MAGTTTMIAKEQLLLAQYLSEIRFKKHEYGIFDCNTWWATWIDRLSGSNVSKDIIGKYDSIETAIEYAKTHNALDYVLATGYTELDDNKLESIPINGDVWIQNFKTHYTGVIIFNGLGWSVTSNQGLIKNLPEYYDRPFTKKFRRF